MRTLTDRLLQPLSSTVKASTAAEIHTRFANANDPDKADFLALLADAYNADADGLNAAIAAYQVEPGAATLARLHAASEPRRQLLLRRLNEVPGGTAMLLAMRSEALRLMKDLPAFAALDADFAHLFSSWFNGGFLELRQLDWSTSGAVLSKLIDYEAVHEIGSWEELRARLEPADRRCYGFFHPMMATEPLIFVEVALTASIPVSIAELLRTDRVILSPQQATTAVFYSISNCQEGLRGIPFGGTLIKQVIDRLKREISGIRCAITLSPMPGFAAWLARQAEEVDLIMRLRQPGWQADPALREPLTRAAARYLLTARGRDVDPVARFHLGNGARIERLDYLGDISAKGLCQSHGMMVNYLYDPEAIEENHRAAAAGISVAASPAVRKLLREGGSRRFPWGG